MMKAIMGVLSLGVLLTYAQQGVTSVSFNVGEIIEKVSHHPVKEGERIVIKDRAYEAIFDERGVTLRARETRIPAEDLIIPVSAKPEIREGRVVYPTSYGEIAFEGTSRGLRYEEAGHSSVFTSPINKYTGNVAKLTANVSLRGVPSEIEGRRSNPIWNEVNSEIATLPSVVRNDKNEGGRAFSTAGEFLLDTNVIYVPQPTDDNSPSIAFDGTNYLVVWQDERIEIDIFGARVSQAGVVLDPAGIAISTANYYQWDPKIAFDGTNYLVVWRDQRSGSNSNDIYGARVGRAGVVLDSNGIPICTAANDQRSPSIAFDGINCLVAWMDYRSGFDYDIYCTRVSRAGAVLDSAGIAVSTEAYHQGFPSIAYDNANYLVVWEDYRSGSFYDIYGARVSQVGAVLDTNGIAISTVVNSNQMHPSIAFDGTNYSVVWTDFRNGSSNPDIYGARVDRAGLVLDSNGIAICKMASWQSHAEIAFDNTNYLVVWYDERRGANVYGARVNQAGVVLDSNGIPICTAAGSASIAFDGTNYLVVWQHYRSGSDWDIYGARVNQMGMVLDSLGIAVSTAAPTQKSPSIAFDDTNYLVVWEDYRNGFHPDIFGIRVSQAGVVLDSNGIPICTAANDQWSPSIAFGDTNYLVVWQDYRSGWNIHGARVSKSGVVLDPNGIVISSAPSSQEFPSIAFDGANYLLVWQDYRSGSYYDIYGARVNQVGTVLDTNGIAICTVGRSQNCPTIAFDGTNYLVAWADGRNGLYSDIYGARVSQAGVVLDPNGIAVSTATNSQYYPSIAFDGTNYSVVWTDFRNGSSNPDIYGARVDRAGLVLDSNGIAICTVGSSQNCPTITFDGTNHSVVWQDYRSGSDWDIYGAKVNTSGNVIDSFVISQQPKDQISPAIAHGQSGQCLVVYSGWTDSVNHRPANTMRIWGKFLPPVGIEEQTDARCTIQDPRLKIDPNPFRRQTQVKLAVAQGATDVGLSIYDVSGRIVKRFNHLTVQPFSQVIWDGSDETGRPLPAGVYFCRLEAGDLNLTKKVVKLE